MRLVLGGKVKELGLCLLGHFVLAYLQSTILVVEAVTQNLQERLSDR